MEEGLAYIFYFLYWGGGFDHNQKEIWNSLIICLSNYVYLYLAYLNQDRNCIGSPLVISSVPSIKNPGRLTSASILRIVKWFVHQTFIHEILFAQYLKSPINNNWLESPSFLTLFLNHPYIFRLDSSIAVKKY